MSESRLIAAPVMGALVPVSGIVPSEDVDNDNPGSISDWIVAGFSSLMYHEQQINGIQNVIGELQNAGYVAYEQLHAKTEESNAECHGTIQLLFHATNDHFSELERKMANDKANAEHHMLEFFFSCGDVMKKSAEQQVAFERISTEQYQALAGYLGEAQVKMQATLQQTTVDQSEQIRTITQELFKVSNDCGRELFENRRVNAETATKLRDLQRQLDDITSSSEQRDSFLATEAQVRVEDIEKRITDAQALLSQSVESRVQAAIVEIEGLKVSLTNRLQGMSEQSVQRRRGEKNWEERFEAVKNQLSFVSENRLRRLEEQVGVLQHYHTAPPPPPPPPPGNALKFGDVEFEGLQDRVRRLELRAEETEKKSKQFSLTSEVNHALKGRDMFLESLQAVLVKAQTDILSVSSRIQKMENEKVVRTCEAAREGSPAPFVGDTPVFVSGVRSSSVKEIQSLKHDVARLVNQSFAYSESGNLCADDRQRLPVLSHSEPSLQLLGDMKSLPLYGYPGKSSDFANKGAVAPKIIELLNKLSEELGEYKRDPKRWYQSVVRFNRDKEMKRSPVEVSTFELLALNCEPSDIQLAAMLEWGMRLKNVISEEDHNLLVLARLRPKEMSSTMISSFISSKGLVVAEWKLSNNNSRLHLN